MIPISYNLRNLTVRRANSIAAGTGIALVVFVVAATLMLNKGIQSTLASSGRDDVAIIMSRGSDAELTSGIQNTQVGLMREQAQVARDKNGAGVAIGELVVVVTAHKVGTDGISNVQIRGTPAEVWDFRPEVTIVEGRRPQPGTNEAVVGKAIAGRFEGVGLGKEFELRKNRPVKIVGIMTSGGSSFESEVWGDLDYVRDAFGREGVVSSVRVRLASASKFDAFKAQVESDKQLGLKAERERVYYEKASEQLAVFFNVMGWLTVFLFGFGALIGAAITMYAAVANRTREIGTLRALGFSRIAILFCFLLESIILAVVGGAIGALLANLLAFVPPFTQVNFVTWSEIAIRFMPSTEALMTAFIVALVMGLLGGLFPAIRASGISPIQAMRD